MSSAPDSSATATGCTTSGGKQCAARMAAALTEIADAVPDGGVALVVSHGAAIRTATAALLGWPAEQALTLRGMENCGWTVLRRRSADEPWRLVAYNRTVPPA